MDEEGRSQTDYYTIRVSNPSSSGEAYFIVSAIAACTYNTDLSSYTYSPVYNLGISHFLVRSSDPPYQCHTYASRHIAEASWNAYPSQTTSACSDLWHQQNHAT